MLCLSLKRGQSVDIDGPQTVTIVSTGRDGKVRLGFTGPNTTNILRHDAKCRTPKAKVDHEPSSCDG